HEPRLESAKDIIDNGEIMGRSIDTAGGSTPDLHSFPTRRSSDLAVATVEHASIAAESMSAGPTVSRVCLVILIFAAIVPSTPSRSEEHTSELQSRSDLVCRLLLEKKNVGFAGDPAFVAGDIVHAI